MKIHLIQRQITLDFDNQTSLLNFLEQHQIHHEYQCRSGYCGSCRVKIKKGKVSYAEAPLPLFNLMRFYCVVVGWKVIWK